MSVWKGSAANSIPARKRGSRSSGNSGRSTPACLKEWRRLIEQRASERGSLQNEQERNERGMQDLKGVLAAATEKEPTDMAERLQPFQKEKTLTLKNIDAAESGAGRRLQDQITVQTGILQTTGEQMLPKMSNFLRDYPEESLELRPEIDFAKDFVALRNRIETEELPRHKERFHEFLSTNLIGDMAMFKSRLERHEEAIHDRIRLVNKALKRIPFSTETFVQIVSNQNRSPEIREFLAELKNCIAGGIHPSDEDRARIFANIRKLMDKFEKDAPWTQRVTDARNWMEFGVRELTKAEEREVNYFAASSGKSGGQKARLAFTILASAIMAQYGLAGNEDSSKTFRLVVIDEAFARTDEENSRQALELFQSLGLQLIVVSPFDAKARIVEDFVDSFHLAVNPERNNSRIRRASRAEYDAAKEGAAAP